MSAERHVLDELLLRLPQLLFDLQGQRKNQLTREPNYETCKPEDAQARPLRFPQLLPCHFSQRPKSDSPTLEGRYWASSSAGVFPGLLFFSV
ncbi:hypothetical protein U0070_026088 [Myodes glareolus]|uniref:Uncharacterized protein n=1 Tax=Myodes glareolus TaxID=447135 RepID=A0AAW0HXD1_MYOGA